MTERAPLVVHADAVLPGDAPALCDGAVVVGNDNEIVDVGRAEEILPRHQGGRVERVKGVVIPGLVNAHTHVELSSLRGKVLGGAGFVPWVDRMMGMRAGERPEDDTEAIEDGASELLRAGTALVGEVTNTLAAVGALARHGIGGIVFHEVFGMASGPALARLRQLEDEKDALYPTWPSRELAYSPAPHTVYTTHPDAIRAAVERARALRTRTTVHLAEHTAERSFLADGTGPFADLARRRRFPLDAFPVPHKTPIALAQDLGLLAPDVLLVHLTDIRKEELVIVAQSGAPVVLCPRSNLFIEVKLPPLPSLLEVGIVPALGTDSLASNLSLDVLAEAKALADRFPAVPAQSLLEMATWAGARALERSDAGRIVRGARPGVVAIEGDLDVSDTCPITWALRQPVRARRWMARAGRAA